VSGKAKGEKGEGSPHSDRHCFFMAGGVGEERGVRRLIDAWGKKKGPDAMWREEEGNLVPTGGSAATLACGCPNRWALPQCQVLSRFKPSKSIQTRSNLLQIISKLIHSKKGLPKLTKFEIKYGFDGLKERNNFIH
jgi:hypothetical protein